LLFGIKRRGHEAGDLILLLVPGFEERKAHPIVQSQIPPDLPVVLHIPFIALVGVKALAVGVGLVEGLVIPEQHV